MFHKVVDFFRRLIDAFRHVRSGGQTTARRAQRRAAAPPRRCSACHQPVQHSADWQDHLHAPHPRAAHGPDQH